MKTGLGSPNSQTPLPKRINTHFSGLIAPSFLPALYVNVSSQFSPFSHPETLRVQSKIPDMRFTLRGSLVFSAPQMCRSR